MLRIALTVLPFVLSLYCLVEVVTSKEDRIRNLPRIAWILIVLFFPVVGSCGWLIAGRPRAQASARSVSPGNDEAFQRAVRERAERQRRAYRAQQEAQQEADREAQQSQPATDGEVDQERPGDDPVS